MVNKVVLFMFVSVLLSLWGCSKRSYNRAFDDGARAMAVDFTAAYRRQQEGRLLHDAHACPRLNPVLADITIPGGLQGEVFVKTQTIPVVLRGTVLHRDCLERVRQ